MIGAVPPFSGINVSSAITCGRVSEAVGAVRTTAGIDPPIEEGAIRSGIESSMGWKRRRARIDNLLRLKDEHKQRYVYIYSKT
jgi:hypothetical protein